AGAALFAADTGYAIVELLPASSAGWVGRTLTLPFAALLGRFGAVLALVALSTALSVATVGWNPLGAAVRRVRGLRRAPREDAAELPDAAPEPEPVPIAIAATQEMPVPEPAAEKPSLVPRLLRRKSSRIVLEDTGDPDSTQTPPL